MNERRIRQLADKAGCQVEAIDRGNGGHYKVWVTRQGKKGLVVVSSTCKNYHMERNVLSDMRKVGR